MGPVEVFADVVKHPAPTGSERAQESSGLVHAPHPIMKPMELSQRLNIDVGSLAPAEEESKHPVSELATLIDATFDTSVTPETPLADAGLSSLDRIELAIRAEEAYGVPVTEEVYQQCATVGELAEYLKQKAER